MNSDANQPADGQAEAVLWFIEHPEALDAMKDTLLQAYIRLVRKRVEEMERAADHNPAAPVPSGIAIGEKHENDA